MNAALSLGAFYETRDRFAVALELAPMAPTAAKVARLMLRMINREEALAGRGFRSWIGAAALAKALAFANPKAKLSSLERMVKRARRQLEALGVIELALKGGRGRGSTPVYRFRPAWLATVEEAARRHGGVAAFGLGRAAYSDQGVTLDGALGDKGADATAYSDQDVTLDGALGDKGADAAAYSDQDVTLGREVTPNFGDKPADKSVGNPVRADDAENSRVTPLNVKSDNPPPVRVTPEPPETKDINPFNPARVRARLGGDGAARARKPAKGDKRAPTGQDAGQDRRQRELRLLQTLEGGKGDDPPTAALPAEPRDAREIWRAIEALTSAVADLKAMFGGIQRRASGGG